MLRERFAAALRSAKTRTAAALALPAALLLASTALVLAPATAQEKAAPKASTFSADQKAEIQRIIKDYLVSHPEVLYEANAALEAKMEQIQAEKMKDGLAKESATLYRDPKAPAAGNPKGDVTIVEFFDYNCGYCKVALKSMSKLIEQDKGVKVVFKEVFFIGRDVSLGASRVALAARNQGKYWEMHRALLELKGTVNEAAALRIATSLQLDMDRLKRDMASPETKKELEGNMALAQRLGVTGTPFFLVGDRIIPGAPENLLETMTKLVGEVRKTGCAVC